MRDDCLDCDTTHCTSLTRTATRRCSFETTVLSATQHSATQCKTLCYLPNSKTELYNDCVRIPIHDHTPHTTPHTPHTTHAIKSTLTPGCHLSHAGAHRRPQPVAARHQKHCLSKILQNGPVTIYSFCASRSSLYRAQRPGSCAPAGAPWQHCPLDPHLSTHLPCAAACHNNVAYR